MTWSEGLHWVEEIIFWIGNFTLCIFAFDKSNKEIEFDRETGVVLRIEGSEYDSIALTVVERIIGMLDMFLKLKWKKTSLLIARIPK